MKIIAINGSPRKNENTAELLKDTLNGAQSVLPNLQTELVHLYDLNYKPCISCLECKRLNGKSYGKCAIKDSLSPVLENCSEADAVIFGSPIYFSNITAGMRAFLERFVFAFTSYKQNYTSLAPKKMPTAFIYTMNATHEQMLTLNYPALLQPTEWFIGNAFVAPKILYANNTTQVDDYSKYQMEVFSSTEKQTYKEQYFPLDKQNAFTLGAELAKEISAHQ